MRPYCSKLFFVQTMNILIVNQSVIDMCASLLTLLTATVERDSTGMSHDSIHDQLVCRIWLTRSMLWGFLVTSTYGILLAALERYTAVIYPIWSSVRAASFHQFELYYLPHSCSIYTLVIPQPPPPSAVRPVFCHRCALKRGRINR